MFTVTFYSFKGGSGRTLALANIGAELAATGRRVLLVDFDLEAPGLHTFPDLQPREAVSGVLDFVCDYQASGQSPDVRDYLYEVPGAGGRGGRLWVMPAGRCDADYRMKLSQLDWKDLYTYQDGYLLIEDMKAQWNTTLAPDYVLIDSRTGHSDVEGICTRQLPDSVAIFFVPNRQNLEGLEIILRGIRLEAKGSRRKNIQTHFVMSNVPDLDDDDQILSNLAREFRQRLAFHKLSGIITHYNSFAVLEQQLLVRKRPRSRLAIAYRRVLSELIRDNTEDREVLLADLRELAGLSPQRQRRSPRALRDEEELSKILARHSRDVDVLHATSMVLRKQRRIDEALGVIDKAISAADGSADESLPSLYVERAELRLILGDKERAAEDAGSALGCIEGTAISAVRAVRVLAEGGDEALSHLAAAPLLKSLSSGDLGQLLVELGGTRRQLAVSKEILLSRIGSDLPFSELSAFLAELILVCVGLGEFDEAIRLSAAPTLPGEPVQIASVFNQAMAHWGQTGRPDPERFASVLQIHDERPIKNPSPNYFQCMAVSYWATSDDSAAMQMLERAIASTKEFGLRQFSCWSYLWVSPDRFLQDCAALRSLFGGAPVEPEFVSANSKPVLAFRTS